MNLKSLGYKTDLMMHAFESRIDDRGSYIVIETPKNPGFYWGNLLVFDRSPTPADPMRWIEIFNKEFQHQPLVKHCTIAWDGPTPVDQTCRIDPVAASDLNKDEAMAIETFESLGFKVEHSVVLTTESINPPPRPNPEIEVRPLASTDEWEQATEVQIACRDEVFTYEVHKPFKREQMARYRRLVDAGHGFWYGAFLNGQLIADLGIFVVDGLARYQTVGTHPDFRRLGACGTLVWQSALHAQKHLGAKTFVMVADEHYHAARIYESVGFKPTERVKGACRYPPEIIT